MKKIFLPLLLLSIAFSNVYAQTNKAYAITAENKGSYVWTAVREIDLATGEVVKNIYAPADAKKVNYSFVNATNAKNISNYQSIAPTANGVAATAFDSKHNRLYFSQMWSNDLRYFDLNNNETSIVVNEDKNYSTGVRNDESNVITRMTFAADGNGYALTNDGNQLIKFTTADKPTITNLGALVDSKKNNGISVHNQCTSWGGDLIADIYGNLYLFTYRNQVFKINITTRIAEHIGAIKNIAEGFTINGAAVNANGDVIVSSAVKGDSYYQVNLSTLDAKPLDTKGSVVYNASDLASENLAYSNGNIGPLVCGVIDLDDVVTAYPNPAVNKTFSLQFKKLPVGAYTLEISNANGKKMMLKNISVTGEQNEKISLPKGAAAGIYLVKIINSNGSMVYNNKVIVQ